MRCIVWLARQQHCPLKMMIFLLSPAKSLDMSACHVAPVGLPEFMGEATFLSSKLASLTQVQLKSLLQVSSDLASLNFERYSHFSAQPTKVTKKRCEVVFLFSTSLLLRRTMNVIRGRNWYTYLGTIWKMVSRCDN